MTFLDRVTLFDQQLHDLARHSRQHGRICIQTGIESKGNVEVVEGLTEDDVIVVVGHGGLRDGSKVLASNAVTESFAG